jgi:6-pyruvoyltetrahydropterin/6-carboxytetrahydropterin synthase
MTTSIVRRFEWDMGHRVTNHRSKCANFHGHRYAALFTLTGDVNREPGESDEGMVMDFADVKAKLQDVIDELDHGFMIWEQDPWASTLVLTGTKVIAVPFIPTAEQIAAYLLQRARAIVGTVVCAVTVHETPNCTATVTT